MYRMAFLPPAEQPPRREALASNPPAMEPSLYIHETPGFLDPGRSLPSLSRVEPLLRRADARYENGRRLFQAGQMEAARREFDRAIDTLLTGTADTAGRQDLDRKLSELTDAIHQYDISGLGAAEQSGEPAYQTSPLEEIPEPTFPIDPKLRDQVAEQLKATVSQLPLELNDDVVRYINYFSTTRGRKTLLYGLERAGRYRPMIQRIFDEVGIPQELIHLAQAESGFAPRAVSRKRAAGMWQFVAWRGQEYGLARTKTIDDRLDPEKATRAAARHLRDLYTEFGDWYLAMAAYNCGPLCVQNAVERTGYADIWELRRRSVLPRETANYVPIILAMVIMSKNPAQYGLLDVDTDPPLEYSTVELDAPVHLQLIADITERPVSEIRALNPALLTPVAPAGYALHLPVGAGGAVLSALDLIPAPRRTAWRLYRVTEGDTLDSIARLYRTTRQQLAAANPAAGDACEPGSLLIVPAPQPTAAPAVRSAGARPAARRVAAAQPSAAKKTTGAPKKAAASAASSKSSSAAGSLVAAKTPAGSRPTAVSR
jgi:membrane-bound lytic murein transglycosylase D